MLPIDQSSLEKFQKIKELFFARTKVPEEENWKKLTNNDIWLKIVAQVVIVGRSDPWDKLRARTDLKEKIAWESLQRIESQDELTRTVNQVLLAVGTRYASSTLSKSVKAQALAHNLNVLKGYNDGPKGFLQKISEFRGPATDIMKIRFVMDSFIYIKNKGARDLLMELGLVRNAIALDVRLRNVLQKAGFRVPNGFQGSSLIYEKIEKDILNKICAPLRLAGVEFDRMLYQNYQDILDLKLE